jgi:hypothetical protein
MKKLLLPTLLAIAVGLSACGSGGGGGLGGTATTPSTPPVQAAVNARYQIVLEDMVAGKPITDALVLTFSGAAALKAADGSSLNGKSITVTSGFVGLDATFNSTTDDFTVKVDDAGAKGWVSTGVTVNNKAGAAGDKLMELKMINITQSAQINASTQPVTVAANSTGVNGSGATTSATTVSTPSTKTVTSVEGTNQPMPSTTVTIPTNTVAKTANGTPASGQVTLAVTSFATSTGDSLQAFPGGFAPNLSTTNQSVLNGASASDAAVTTGGFAQFTMKDAAGNELKTFSQPVTVSMDLAKGTLDGNGNPVAAGQQFPIWSFNDANQTWTFETMGTIAEKNPVDPNYFSVTFQTSHFSWWAAIAVRQTCNSTISITGRPAGDTRELVVDVVGGNGNRFHALGNTTTSTMDLVKLPKNAIGSITVTDAGKVVGRVTNQPLCGAPSVAVTLQPPTVVPVGNVRVETSESCTDGSNQRALPTFVNVGVINSTTGTSVLPGYTNTVETNLDSFLFTSVPAGTVTVSAQNPHNNQWEQKLVTVPANGSVTASFNFTTSCSQVTGGF